MPETIELDGKTFAPAEQLPIPEWPCVNAERPLPTLTLKDDDLFFIADTLGNISCSDGDTAASLGLFCRDTRFLSRLELQLEGRSPVLLSSDARRGFVLSVLCTNPRIDHIAADTIGIEREIVINGGLFEELTITNYSTSPIRFEMTLSFDADFIDLFEVRGAKRSRRGKLLRPLPNKQTEATGETETEGSEGATVLEAPEVDTLSAPTELLMAYLGVDNVLMESHIQFLHQLPDFLKGHTAIWQIELGSHETQRVGYRLQPLSNNRPASTVSAPTTLMQAKAAELMEEQAWQSTATKIRTDNKAINEVLERAEQDVYLLRQTFGKDKALSAGVPWFSALFGRDSIIAAAQTLILDPSIARQTLIILAHYQGKTYDEWREEEPGKILHELRLGEMARCQEVPHTPYYGTIDATPLWLMLYAEYYAWTHDYETLEKLWDNALAAMEWVDRNCQQTGYLSYYRLSSGGLANQGWKDSDDCIVDRFGKLATGSIALCEVQAYVYAAKVRLSEIARMKKRLDLADRWQEEARELKLRFNRDFWLPEQDYCALALDGDGKQVDGISSNPGHCLQLGILSPEKAQSVAERLHAPDMFNGWGIRTLSSLSPAYNPMGYHTGSVWPHDNGLIVLGLRSIGLVEQALEVAQGLIDMTLQQPYQRPPELFCGYERNSEGKPIQYPVACSPQAWATGTIFQLLRMMINLVPDAPNNHLRVIDPALPESINRLSIQNLRVGTTLLDLEFVRGQSTEGNFSSPASCQVVRKRGNLRVVIEA
ncbi:amylo-alpha-1,6-glucosidase [Oculatella sp. LEGE 06141]|uniref:amylo-alpha-1,6-glucosidase n=1 Tax=Oculatella sp. LEGE 06141 TaxID=1828648 RepID=UPI00187E72C3|nr:amylo-alpha-1,6-glucosidase [Oculatella sp. LEGE 06141]MBE9177837.1 amylo-alpha-1,6-glucosidase [Oculatella sp. LEGE 06141]